MAYLFYIIIIGLCAVVSGIVLMICHLRGRGSKERTLFTLAIAGCVALLLIDFYSLDEIFDHTSVPFSSWIPTIITVVFLAVYAILANSKLAKHYKEYAQNSLSIAAPAVAVVFLLALLLVGPRNKEREDDIYADGYESGYDAGYQVGVEVTREESSDEWSVFFEEAQLVNTVTGEPILSREDFEKWKVDYAEAKASRSAK